MPTRNTRLIREIVEVLSDLLTNKKQALAQLENSFSRSYILNAGDVDTVAQLATRLRLSITEEEGALVLNAIAAKKMVCITIDHVETAVFELFGNRFIEPGNEQ